MIEINTLLRRISKLTSDLESYCALTRRTVGELSDSFLAHVEATTDVHGATSSAIAERIIIRDAYARAKVNDPSADDDIDTQGARNAAIADHASATTGVHGVGSYYIPQAPLSGFLIRSFCRGWTSGKFLQGAGVGNDPSEVDPPTFTYVEIYSDQFTPPSAGWSVWDISGIVPVGTKYVEVYVRSEGNGSAYVLDAGARKYGSTLDRRIRPVQGYYWCGISTTLWCEVGTDRKIEVYQSAVGAYMRYRIIGYII